MWVRVDIGRESSPEVAFFAKFGHLPTLPTPCPSAPRMSIHSTLDWHSVQGQSMGCREKPSGHIGAPGVREGHSLPAQSSEGKV
jgi:hypothetical protein